MSGGRPGRPFGPLVSLEERLTRRRRIDELTGCWEWLGATTNGYGRIAVDGRVGYVHRISWEFYREAIPVGLVIDHLCENRQCFNPDHLEVVTVAENTNRRRDAPSSRTHCPQGHRYAGENLRTYVSPDGYEHRVCRICNKIKCLKWRERRAGVA